MRLVLRVLVVTLLLGTVIAPVQAALYTDSSSSGPDCAHEDGSSTCEESSRTETGVEVEGTRVVLVQEHHRTNGSHEDATPNSWDITEESTGAEAEADGRSLAVHVTERTYFANQTEDGRERRTTEEGYRIEVRQTQLLPADFPGIGFTERKVDDDVHQCAVTYDGGWVTVPCNPPDPNDTVELLP